jgi:hypothetical protein
MDSHDAEGKRAKQERVKGGHINSKGLAIERSLHRALLLRGGKLTQSER